MPSTYLTRSYWAAGIPRATVARSLCRLRRHGSTRRTVPGRLHPGHHRLDHSPISAMSSSSRAHRGLGWASGSSRPSWPTRASGHSPARSPPAMPTRCTRSSGSRGRNSAVHGQDHSGRLPGAIESPDAYGNGGPTTYLNFIDGEWRASRTGRTFENINPADTRDVVGLLQDSDASDVDAAVQAAQKAFPAGRPCRRRPRGEILPQGAAILEGKDRRDGRPPQPRGRQDDRRGQARSRAQSASSSMASAARRADGRPDDPVGAPARVHL